MILQNARIRTMDEALPMASALAIAGGRVIGGVDAREDAIASQAHERIDLQGACVVPGFVDSHVHFRSWALSRVRVDLSAARTAAELFELVSKHAGTLEPDSWVLGRGWHDSAVRTLDDPAGELLHAAGGRPCALVSHDGHALLTTRDVPERVGLAEADLDVSGGVVGRTSAGAYSGVTRERSSWIIRQALPDPDATTAVFASAMRAANAAGVTSVHDMDGVVGFSMWQQLERERGLTLRVWQNFLADELPHLAALGLRPNFGSDRLRVGGIKVFADGTLSSGTAWLHEPEESSSADGREAVVITGQQEMADLAAAAGRAGFPLLVHAIGDAAATAALDALEQTHPLWSSQPVMPRIEHAQLMRPTDIERSARLGVGLSVQPVHLLDDRDTADVRWGDRCINAFAFRSMLDSGACLLLGSDAPIGALDPLGAIAAATERRLGDDGHWYPAQRITADEALLCSTVTPYEAMSSGARHGRLVPGCAADLVVLSDDPLSAPAEQIEVVATMVGGSWAHGRANL